MRGLRDDIIGLENQISSLRTEITTDKEWKKDFQAKLELQATNIDKLLKGLDEEKSNRLAAEKQFTDELGEIKVMQAKSSTRGKSSHTLLIVLISILVTAIISVGITLLGVWLARK